MIKIANYKNIFFAGALLIVGTSAVAAPIPSVYSTGVDDAHNALSVGSAETHYTVSSGINPVVTENAFYIPNDSSAAWITGLPDGFSTATYQTSFDLTGFNIATAVLNLGISVDNVVIDVLINGVSTGFSLPFGFPAQLELHPLTISSGFVEGINTLQFLTRNEGGPGGIRVVASGSADPVIMDSDNDGVLDISDNCPDTPNADQADNDLDGFGNACDADDDNDGVEDITDNCAFDANADQSDVDGDGAGDVCDDDLDGDNILNANDNCPMDPNTGQTNTDGDTEGDACDANDDNDAFDDVADNCPLKVNDDQADLDEDGIGDVCDIDVDGDGIYDVDDNCPVDANSGQDDADFDGAGDECDTDDDNDGVVDVDDNCPSIVNTDQTDTDGDGSGDVCDNDLDGDGFPNEADNCPVDANPSQNDLDGDGEGDTCDTDIDGDGVTNTSDLCPGTPLSVVIDTGSGCSIAQLCPCDGQRGTTDPWRNHGKYVSCVAKSSKNFVELGLITEVEKDEIVSSAAQSSCGMKN